MNFGHGEAPLYACPRAKSAPLAENSTVFSVSAPIAFDAAAIVVAGPSHPLIAEAYGDVG